MRAFAVMKMASICFHQHSTDSTGSESLVCKGRFRRVSCIIWLLEFCKGSLSCLGFSEDLIKSKHDPKKERKDKAKSRSAHVIFGRSTPKKAKGLECFSVRCRMICSLKRSNSLMFWTFNCVPSAPCKGGPASD